MCDIEARAVRTFGALKPDSLYSFVGYRAMLTVEWKTPGGMHLGTRTIDYSGTNDYRCYTNGTFAKCSVYTQAGFGVVVFWQI